MPKHMDFVEAKASAAREIALAFGVPPLVLGLPGDNTFSNYQEANRAFWRQAVIPLVKRTQQSFAAWLQPAYGEFSIEADLDKIDALAGERETEWRRIGAAGFLSDDEKREALGYAGRKDGALGRKVGVYDITGDSLGDVNDNASGGADGIGGDEPWRRQPRVPAGNEDGGQWTDGGGGATIGAALEADERSIILVGGITEAEKKMNVQAFISANCKGSIMSVMPGQFLTLQILDVMKLAAGGDRDARSCIKLLSRDEYRK